MTTYLLDTSVIIDVLNGKRERDKLLRQLLTEGCLLACCAINIAEVYAGMQPREKIPTEKLLNSLIYYDITSSVAAKAGSLKYEFAGKGVTLSISDVLIAAVALAYDLTLVTDNLKHYPMSGLRLYPLTS
jgi:predicted nucleic acid-binding protein